MKRIVGSRIEHTSCEEREAETLEKHRRRQLKAFNQMRNKLIKATAVIAVPSNLMNEVDPESGTEENTQSVKTSPSR